MTVSDILELYRYNRWANAQALDATSVLANEQLHKNLGTSHGSVFGTLLHILWGEWRWLGRWQGSAPPGPDPLETADFQELRQRWSAFVPLQEAFLGTLREPDLGRVISYQNPPGTTWSYALSHMLQHVVNHSTYHRGQVAALLRQLGVAPHASDFLVFFDMSAGSGA